MKHRYELLKRLKPRLVLKTNQTAVKADSRATELLKTNKFGKTKKKDFIWLKTRKLIRKRPGKTWKITLPIKYIEIANSNSFYAQ